MSALVTGGGLYPPPLMDSSLFLSLAPCVQPLEKPHHAAGAPRRAAAASLDALPDACLREILRRLPGRRDRAAASCVSRRWLMLLGSIRVRLPLLPDLNKPSSTEESSPPAELVCCLEGADATDARLAAVAVRDSAAVESLAVRSTCGVGDPGIQAAARCCPALRAVALWGVAGVSDAGLAELAQGCGMLETLDLAHCPGVSDAGLAAVAEGCRDLVSLAVESCAGVTCRGLLAVAGLCRKLEKVSVAGCPLVSDEGVCGLASSCGSTLRKLRLQGIPISDLALGVVGYYGREISELVLVDLPDAGERGFWVMGSTHGLRKLTTLKVTTCRGFTDVALAAIVRGCPLLAHLFLRRAPKLSDAGLGSISSAPLENLLLDDCKLVTLPGLVSALAGCRNLNSITVSRCVGIRDDDPFTPPTTPLASVRSLSIRGCPAFGNASVETLARLLPELRTVDLRSLPGVTDAGVLALLGTVRPGLATLNLSNCPNVTDASVAAAARLHGATLETLALEGCRRVSDASLLAVADACPKLANLDVSSSAVTDVGIAALASSGARPELRVLSLAGCRSLTSKSLWIIANMMGRSLAGLNLQRCPLLGSAAVGSLQERLWWCDILY